MKSLFKEIFSRLRQRNFSGNTGLAIKNTVYQSFASLSIKIGSLLFSIIIARLLLPELFGLYSLALSTILIFSSFSDLGVGQATIRFISKELGAKRLKKTKAYLIYFGKIRIILSLLSVLALIVLSHYLSFNYYQKPIYWALLAGVVYILFYQITTFLHSLFQSINYFRGLVYKETSFQILRIVILTPFLLLIPKLNLSTEKILFIIILLLAFAYLLVGFFMVVMLIKKENLFGYKRGILSKNERQNTNKFLFWAFFLAFSGTFFTYIDQIMLGRFVDAQFIGYYGAAMVLIGALIPLLSGSVNALMPIFSRISGKTAERGFSKSIKIIFTLSLIVSVLTLLFAKYIILIFYGQNYFNSINILKLSSVLIIVLSMNSFYSTYLLSQDKPKIVALLLASSTIITIILNYVFITYLLKFGQLAAVYGVIFAAIIGQLFYLAGLIMYHRKNKLQNEG